MFTSIRCSGWISRSLLIDSNATQMSWFWFWIYTLERTWLFLIFFSFCQWHRQIEDKSTDIRPVFWGYDNNNVFAIISSWIMIISDKKNPHKRNPFFNEPKFDFIGKSWCKSQHNEIEMNLPLWWLRVNLLRLCDPTSNLLQSIIIRF